MRNRVVLGLGFGLVLGGVAEVEGQVRFIPKTTVRQEYYYQPYTYTYTYYVAVPRTVTVNRTCWRVVGGRSQSYSCPYSYTTTNYEPRTRVYTYYQLKVRAKTEVEMVAVPDVSKLAEQLAAERELNRTREAVEANLAKVSAEMQGLFAKNRLTDDLHVAAEPTGDERFLSSFSSWGLARAVHAPR